ncbi:MAG: DUF1232 domain-containing protein [Muribaculaceae bacterium]|nr:DUF1232 domain-containing protein [Muribaculaceae bacterium]
MDKGTILAGFQSKLEEFSKNFSVAKLWEKIQKNARKLGVKVVFEAQKLFYMLQDPVVNASDKLIITAALGYMILPLDLVPDFIPGGFIDDGVILTWALNQLKGKMTESTLQKAKSKLREWFPNVTDAELS